MTSMVRSRSKTERTVADEIRSDGTRAIIITDTFEETIEQVAPVINQINHTTPINHINQINQINHINQINYNIIMVNKSPSFEIPIIKINDNSEPEIDKVKEEEELVKEKKVEQQEYNKSKDSEKKQDDDKLINNDNLGNEVKEGKKVEQQENNKSNNNDKKQENIKLTISNNNYIINEVKEGKKVEKQEKPKDSDKKQEDNKLIINYDMVNEVKEGKKIEQQEDNKSKDNDKKQEDNKLIINNNMDREVKKEEKFEEQGNNKSNDNDKKQEDNKLTISNNYYIINVVKEGKKVEKQEKSKDSDKKQEDNKLINNDNLEKFEEQGNNKSNDNDKKQENIKLTISNNNYIINEVKEEEKVEEQEKSKDSDKKQEDNKLIINNNIHIINEVKEGIKVEQQEDNKLINNDNILSFGIFLAALDQTIIVTTLPAIGKEFRKFDQITWIGTAYLLTATASQPTFAKLTDIFGRKGPFLSAVIIFVIGSVVCGAAPNINALIVGRAIAGLGGGGILGLVLVIVAEMVPTEQRGKYQGIIGGFFAISSAIGPILGGIFVDYVTWSAITLITVIFFFHPPNNNKKQESLIEKLKRVDWWGTLVLTTSIFLILLAFNWGGAKYEWYHPAIIVLLCVGGIGFLLFAFIEGYVAKEPLTPALLFKKRSSVASFAVTFFQGMSFFTLVYFVPLYFQLVKGSSATVFATIFAGILITLLKKTSYCTHLCILGSVLITIGTGLISTFTENSTRGELTGYLIIAGIGAGLIMPTTISFVQIIVPKEHIAAASCLISLFRTIGGVFGIAIVGVILNNDINNHMNDLVGALFTPSPLEKSQQLTPFLKDALSSFNDIDIDNLPPAVKITFMRIFVISFQTAFKVDNQNHITASLSCLWIQKSIPLQNVKVEANVVDMIAEEDKNIEALYKFPIYEAAAICDFEAEIDGKYKVKGIVKEAKQAASDYNEAIEKGYSAYLLEEQLSDVFQCSIGNLKSNQTVVIKITYVTELKHDSENEKIRFVLPTSIAERYGSSSSSTANYGKKLVPDDVKYSGKANYQLDLKINCRMTSTIQSIESPSHLISTELNVNGNPKTSNVTLAEQITYLEKDFILVVKSEDLDKPRAFLEYNPKTESNCLMLTLVPKFSLNPIQTEIVFIIDRSGSMQGEPIKKAGQALELFLHSLPEDCYFNVVSFGSSHDSLFPKSQEYSQETLDRAINLAKNLDARYGGTEIYNPIKWALDNQLKTMTTTLFLLTDGKVWGVDKIIELINQNVEDKNNDLRIFTLGIGDNVSHNLVESVARSGNGYAEFVTNKERMDKKILGMLKNAVKPPINDYRIKWTTSYDKQDEDENKLFNYLFEEKEEKKDKPVISFYSNEQPTSITTKKPEKPKKDIEKLLDHVKLQQAPYKIPEIYPGVRFTVYCILSKGVQPSNEIILTAKSSDGPMKLNIPIDHVTLTGSKIHTLASRKLIQDLEENRSFINQHPKSKDKTIPDYIFKDYIKPPEVRHVPNKASSQMSEYYSLGCNTNTNNNRLRNIRQYAVSNDSLSFAASSNISANRYVTASSSIDTSTSSHKSFESSFNSVNNVRKEKMKEMTKGEINEHKKPKIETLLTFLSLQSFDGKFQPKNEFLEFFGKNSLDEFNFENNFENKDDEQQKVKLCTIIALIYLEVVMMKDFKDECDICYEKSKKALTTKFNDYNEENVKNVMDSVRKWINDWIKE
ncbi:13712_t:CDS:10 [Entrophospora sp. SA101]|nr:13712_t:CDS:10 [Entrophospora sp. SA101]